MPRRTGYVGDHADKLGRVRPLPHDDDERPSREDLQYGNTVFTRLSTPFTALFGRKRKRR
jgi:hypothetical protein